jgi:hypothetical protein
MLPSDGNHGVVKRKVSPQSVLGKPRMEILRIPAYASPHDFRHLAGKKGFHLCDLFPSCPSCAIAITSHMPTFALEMFRLGKGSGGPDS